MNRALTWLKTRLGLVGTSRNSSYGRKGPRVQPSRWTVTQLETRIVPAADLTGLLSPITATATPVAEVAAGPRLASIDTTQSALLNGLLTSLAGANSGLALSAVDYTGLAGSSLNLGTLLGGLQTRAGAASPTQALTADATLGQLLGAAVDAAQADGDTALASALNQAVLALGPVSGTVRLGDLLKLDLPQGSLAQARVNALDLLTGIVELFNAQNVAALNAPVTLSGAALGVPGVVNSVTLQARVVEPPVVVVGGQGTAFNSAAIRLKLNVDLVDTALDTSALTAPIQALLNNPLASVTATASLGQLQLFADVGRGSGVIQAIDAVSNAVTLQATPALVDVYLGTIDDAVFANRARPIDPATDLTPGTLGSITVTATAPVVGNLLNVTAPITIRSSAEASSGLQVVPFAPPYPQSKTVGSSTTAVGNLAAGLASNLQIGLGGSLGVLQPLAGTLTDTLTAVAKPAVGGVLNPLLANLANPALNGLGVGVGEIDLAVLGADSPDAATAVNDSVLTLQGRPVNALVLANDLNPNNLPLTFSLAGNPASGTVVVNGDKSVTYTPNAGFLGTDTFSYTLSDSFGRSSTATVSVFVGKAPDRNGSPAVNPDSATTQPNQPVTIAVLANDTDPDGDPLALVGVAPPAHGSVAVNPDGTLTYTPVAGYQGTDSFAYSAGDGKGGVGEATVTVVVGSAASADGNPTIRPDTGAGGQGTPTTIAVLANDTDPDGDPLTVIGLGQPANGNVVLNPDGTVTYTPNPGFTGQDRFTYTASDGKGGVGGTAVTVTGAPAPANHAPTTNPDLANTPVDQTVTVPVLANDTDPEGDSLTITGVTRPGHGSATANANGTVTYTPAAGFRGTDTFSYTASDAKGGSSSAVVTVRVGLNAVSGGVGTGTGTNHAPTIYGDSATTQPDQPVTVPVLANDTDADGDPLTIAGVTQPAHGKLTVNADGSLTYTPDSGYRGVDTFGYTASDGKGGSGSGAVQVVVGQGGKGPVLAELKQYVVGADTTGGPRVTEYNPDGSVRFDFFAYDPNDRTGVNAALGDLNGDGIADIVTSPGFGGGPRIRVFSGKDLSVIADFFAFDGSFRGGCNISVGDLNGDGVPELVVAAGKGGGPHVRVIDGTQINRITAANPFPDGMLLDNFYAFDSSFGGGVSVAVTDLDGNGVGELVTGAGPGGPPLARIWDIPSHKMTAEFMAFDPNFSAGLNVGGHGDYIVFGAGKGDAPEVRVYHGPNRDKVADFMAYETTFHGGVRVNFGDTIDASRPLLLVGAGAGGGPRIKVLRPNQNVVIPDYFAFEDSFRGGVFVA